MDLLVILGWIGGAMTVVNQTLVRRKNWLGWLFAIPNIGLFMYVQFATGNPGYAALVGPFWFFNAVLAIKQWRRAPLQPPRWAALEELLRRSERESCCCDEDTFVQVDRAALRAIMTEGKEIPT